MPSCQPSRLDKIVRGQSVQALGIDRWADPATILVNDLLPIHGQFPDIEYGARYDLKSDFSHKCTRLAQAQP